MFVKISETYDLSTKPGKMSLIALHTPEVSLARKMWSGLFAQHKYFRFVSCDVAMACASTLPADPLQIGTEAGDIAPQDMFNPILYRACSNDSFNVVLNRIASLVGYNSTAISGDSVDAQNDPQLEFPTDDVDQFAAYYGLLADEGWKKSMPQSGMMMKGLYPIVFSVLTNTGMISDVRGNGVGLGFPDDEGVASSDGVVTKTSFPSAYMRGNPMKMPRIPTHFQSVDSDGNSSAVSVVTLPSVKNSAIPKCMVGAIIMPPCKLNRLYYRMKVTWTIEFSELCSSQEWDSWSQIADIGNASYATDYTVQTQSMTNMTNMVDTSNADIHKIMEGTK